MPSAFIMLFIVQIVFNTILWVNSLQAAGIEAEIPIKIAKTTVKATPNSPKAIFIGIGVHSPATQKTADSTPKKGDSRQIGSFLRRLPQ